MFARLTFIDVTPEHQDDFKQIYEQEIVSVVRSQKGNIGIWLLEPTDNSEQYISLSEWLSKADADEYEASGTYRKLVDRLKHAYKNKPTLRTYNIKEARIIAPVS
jgi:heme-degrading monooxygenase HmoA